MKDPDYEDTAKPNREKLFRIPWRVLLSSVLGMAVPVQEVYHKRSGENRDYLEEGGGIGGDNFNAGIIICFVKMDHMEA